MRQCIGCLGRFGRQREDVNITLAAVGLLWSVSDAVQANLKVLWLCLLLELLELSRDPRLEVRTSAMQSLFRCIELYGNKLPPEIFEQVIWEIIFPLLEGAPGDESQVLALTSVGTIFSTFFSSLCGTSSSDKVFLHLLDLLKQIFFEAPRKSCSAALKVMQQSISSLEVADDLSATTRSGWYTASWQAFEQMGDAIPLHGGYTQENLLEAVRVASLLQDHISLDQEQSQKLSSILCAIMTYTQSPDYRPDVDVMSPLQSAIFDVVSTSRTLKQSIILSDFAQFASLAYLGDSSAKLTYVALSKSSMPKMAELYDLHASDPSLYEDGTVENIISVSISDLSSRKGLKYGQAYSIPIKLKYDCPESTKYGDAEPPLWKIVCRVSPEELICDRHCRQRSRHFNAFS